MLQEEGGGGFQQGLEGWWGFSKSGGGGSQGALESWEAHLPLQRSQGKGVAWEVAQGIESVQGASS